MICRQIERPSPECWPKFSLGPLGVEALEDRFELVLGNARALVVDGDDERSAARLAAELDHDAARPAG